MQDTAALKFEEHPWHVLVDVASLRRQPYLSAVLPMYAVYALLAPIIVYCAQRSAWRTLGVSAAAWLLAPVLAGMLPSVCAQGWSFNPFAWQLMFVCGVIVKIQPPGIDFQRSRIGWSLTGLAIAAIIGFAVYRLFLQSAPEPGYMKQNLSVYRVTNFLALAWLAGQLVRLQWVKPVAKRMPWVIAVGRQGLPCFVCGAAISLVADTLLQSINRTAPAPSEWLRGLASDTFSIVALLIVAQLAEWRKRRAAALATPARVQPR